MISADEQTYYAHRCTDGCNAEPYYMHTSPEHWWVEIHRCPEPIVALRVRERQATDAPSDYWGWLETGGDEHYLFVQPCRDMFNVCFPYGPAAEEKHGKGRAVNLIVEEIPA